MNDHDTHVTFRFGYAAVPVLWWDWTQAPTQHYRLNYELEHGQSWHDMDASGLLQVAASARSTFGNFILDKTDALAVASIDFTGQRLPTQRPLAEQIRQSLTSRSPEQCAKTPRPECSSPR
ncbi:MAG: hypothetical protein OXJ64_14795 [Boseongicola sp.]|nr:hypothetical protein [Boseongicola sp.]